tara:strand:+ start:2026 stop:7125 length:5100 start_codon:yes stop_codon:yes gene_type:complete
MIYPENPNFEDEYDAEIKTKEQRFSELNKLLSQNSALSARLAVNNINSAPYLPTEITAGAALVGQNISELSPETIQAITDQIQRDDKTTWDGIVDKLKGGVRGTFAAFDAGLDFVKGQLLGRFPVEIGQRYADKIAEGLSAPQAINEVFDEFDEIRQKVGDTAFTLAIREGLSGREVNLGEGLLPNSTPIVDTDEYKELIARNIAPDLALQIAEDIVGKPLTQIARQQAVEGVQFRGETAAGLEARGEEKFVTLGRIIAEPFVAMDVIEPGSRAYRNLSGSVDLVGAVVADPANWLLAGAGVLNKTAKSIKYVDEAQKAKQIAELGGITGGIRKSVIKRMPKLGGYSVEGFMDSQKGQSLVKFLSRKVDDAGEALPGSNVDYLATLMGGKKPDYRALDEIAKISDEGEMYTALTDYFTGNLINQKLPFSTKMFNSYTKNAATARRKNVFSKLTGLGPEAQFGIGPAIKYNGKWSAVTRLMGKLYEPGLDPTDVDGSLLTIQKQMAQMDLPTEVRGKILSETIEELKDIDVEDAEILKQITLGSEGTAFEALVDPLTALPVQQAANTFKPADVLFNASVKTAKAFKDTLQKQVDDDLLSETIVNQIVSIYDKPLREAGLNFVDEAGEAFNFGSQLKAYLNGSPIDIPTFRLSTELAQNYIPILPASKVVKATNILKKEILANTPLKRFAKTTKLDDGAVTLLADKYISQAWKPAVLLRGAWTTRVIAEEQIRMWARGYTPGLSPRRLIALVTGREFDPTGTLGIVKKIEKGMPDNELDSFIFQEFPDLPKRFKYKGEEIGMAQAIRRYVNGEKDLVDIVELTSKETEVMAEFFDAISGTHKGYQGLRTTNPNIGRKSFGNADKNENPVKYVDHMMTEFAQLVGDKTAKKILEVGPREAKEFIWNTRYDADSIAASIARQNPYFQSITTNKKLVEDVVDYINARIHLKTGGMFDKETLQITRQGNAELLEVLRTGVYKDKDLTKIGSVKALRKEYKKMFDDNFDNLPAIMKGRGSESAYGARSEIGKSYDQLVENMFYAFMTMPTNKLSRAPVFKQAYWNKVTDLITVSSNEMKKLVIEQARKSNVSESVIKKMQKTVAASDDKAIFKIDVNFKDLTPKQMALRAKGELPTDPYKSFEQAFNAMDDVSKAHALNETKALLYDLSERTRFWEASRLIFPFGEAYQEIITTWAKILQDNPAPLRRFQLTVEKGRETNPFDQEDTDRGFFYTDPVTQEEMFAFPGWGGLASRWMKIQEDDPVQLEASGFAQSVNLIGQSFLPGFGPLVQVPASYLTKSLDPESDIVKFIFGDFPPQPTESPLGYFKTLVPVPSWLKKFIQAYELDPEGYERLQTNTTIDVYNALYYAGRVSDENYAEWKEGMDLAKDYAKVLTQIRGIAQFLGPTGFTPRWQVLSETPEGRQFIFVAALAQDYREKLEELNGDQFATVQYFQETYGIDPTALLTGKSSQVFKRPVTVEGSKFYQDNIEVFEEYTSTAYFAKPDDPNGEFSYDAYLLSLQDKSRVPLNEDQWRLVRNNILGSLAWEQFMLSIEPGYSKPFFLRSDEAAKQTKTLKKMTLKQQYFGWGDSSVPGLARGADLDRIIDEFYRWENNQVLSNSEAGQGLALYLNARENAKAESVRLGYSENGFKNARALTNVREYLTDYADYVIRQYPDFQYIWNSYFKRELLEAQKDEMIEATIKRNY